MRSKLVVLCAIALGACGLFPDLSSLTKDGGSSVDASSDTGTTADVQPDAPVSTCPSKPLPATCDSNLLSDPKNCCVAGRDCQGGACTNGMCQPVVIVSDATTDARGIAQTGNLVVWATGCNNQLRKVAKDGTGNVSLPAGKNCTPTLALSGANAYWIEWNGPYLNTAPLDNSQPASIVAEVSGARSDFARLAVDGQNGYWATTTPAGVWYAPLASNHIAALPLAGGSAKETVVSPYGVAVDSDHVYWADEGGGFIKRRALASLGQDILADLVWSEASVHDITVDAKNVYFTTSDGFVRYIVKDGSTKAVTLASSQTNAESIVVDDQYVYWTIYAANGTVNRVPKTGGNVEPLASGQNYPYSITQDCDTIYWTNQANFSTGEVVKVAK